MKKATTFLFLTFLIGQCFSQMNNCDELKKQNQVMQDKLKQFGIDITDNSTKVNSYSNDIKVNYIKCIGDKKQQTVKLYFNLTNLSLPNQTVRLQNNTLIEGRNMINTQAVDEIGTGYLPIKVTFGATNLFYQDSKLSTGGLPILGTVTFANILPSISKLSEIDIIFKSKNLLGEGNEKEGIAEFKNVKIDWK